MTYHGGTWTAAAASLGVGRLSNLHLALDDQGRALAVWNAFTTTLAVIGRYFDGHSWGGVQTLAATGYFPDLIMTPSGDGFLSFVTGTATQSLSYLQFGAVKGAWGSTHVVNTESVNNFFRPRTAYDGNGDICLGWEQRATGGALSVAGAILGTTAAGVWTTPTNLIGADSQRLPLMSMPVSMSHAGACIVGWLGQPSSQSGAGYNLYANIFE